uniref:Uncharacterized protein n=1 Tax=Oryzias latipes TaxID=8090 RepID=A0A3P9JL23_ORYLA
MSSFPQCNGITGKLHAKINSTISASECLNFMVLCFCVEGPKYRDWVSNTIRNNRDETFQLNSPDGATLTVGLLDDTKCNAADLNAWGKFFLPTTVQMQVVGYVEGSPYPCDQLVLMTCEDKKFYGYDGDELHLVAPSLEHLCRVGVDYPASRSFYRGEAFKHTVRNTPLLHDLCFCFFLLKLGLPLDQEKLRLRFNKIKLMMCQNSIKGQIRIFFHMVKLTLNLSS